MDKPGKVSIPTVTIVNPSTDTSVYIDWIAPDNHFSTITQYEIVFKKSDGSFVTYASCLGTDSTIVSNTECTVDMLGLKSTLGLAVDSLI